MPSDPPVEARPAGALVNLAAIMVRPRATIRRILDQPRDRMVFPLVLLALLSSSISDYDLGALVAIIRNPPSPHLPLIITAALIASVAAGVGLFYFFAWLAAYIGRRIEGVGTARDLRSALAWGLAPLVWALIFRIPISVFFAFGDVPKSRTMDVAGERFITNAGVLSHGCAWATLAIVLEMTAFVWWVATASLTVGEAHRFSGWQGLGTLALTAAVPLVIIISLVIAAIV
ncbi:MAG: YIP1 family protein [Thermoanaerobaculia bacterium]